METTSTKENCTGVEQTYPPTTAEEKLARKNNQLEILGKTISQEDMNLKFLRSLSSEWKTHTFIWRNKPDLDTLSMDNLYNNLNVYETEVKGSSSLNQNSQNVAFVSSNNSGSSNQAYGSNSTNTDSMSDAIDADYLEEMDLKWQMAKLTMRARRFLNKTGRKFNTNGSKTIGYNKSKVECYNYHKKDGLGYDWSDQAEEGPTNFTLMAFTSSGSSSSSSSDYEVLIKQLRDNVLTELRKKFENAEKQRDDLKLTLEKFGNSSKNLSKLLEIQENERYKTSEEYRAVPPPYTGNFMPPKYDLILADEGEYVFSEYMTRNKSYLSDYKEIDGRFVAFWRDPKSIITRVNGKTIQITPTNSKADRENRPNWLFEIDASITISMNYKPVMVWNQTNGNAGTKEYIVAGQDGKKIVPDQKFLLAVADVRINQREVYCPTSMLGGGGFEDPEFPNKVYKVEKALYVYIKLLEPGELTFFLGLQMKQKDDGIFISQDKYVADILKVFDFATVKTENTPIETNKALLKDEKAEDVDVYYTTWIGIILKKRFRSVPGAQDTIIGGGQNLKLGLIYPHPSKKSNDPSLSGVNTLGSGEDSMKLMELMELCTKLSERILDNKNKKSDLVRKRNARYNELKNRKRVV
ncbi:hypothetical protein Tco_0104996 [Tanacetum coccineum]